MSIRQYETIKIKRSLINVADYNPRKMTADSKNKLRKNLESKGLMGGMVWNKTTGNLVSGHQRLSILDKANKYPANDYEVVVIPVELSLEDEKAQNIFFNNQQSQGFFDNEKLSVLMKEIKFDEMSGFDKKQSISMFGTTEHLSQEEYEKISKQVQALADTFKNMTEVNSSSHNFYFVVICKNADDKINIANSYDLVLDDETYIKAEDFINAIIKSESMNNAE